MQPIIWCHVPRVGSPNENSFRVPSGNIGYIIVFLHNWMNRPEIGCDFELNDLTILGTWIQWLGAITVQQNRFWKPMQQMYQGLELMQLFFSTYNMISSFNTMQAPLLIGMICLRIEKSLFHVVYSFSIFVLWDLYTAWSELQTYLRIVCFHTTMAWVYRVLLGFIVSLWVLTGSNYTRSTVYRSSKKQGISGTCTDFIKEKHLVERWSSKVALASKSNANNAILASPCVAGKINRASPSINSG